MNTRSRKITAILTAVVMSLCVISADIGYVHAAGSALDITINAKTVSKRLMRLNPSAKNATTIILGSKVRKIEAEAFKGSKVKTVIIRSKELSKARVKNCFKGSKVSKVEIFVSKSEKTNEKYLKKYKKCFTKKNCGQTIKSSNIKVHKHSGKWTVTKAATCKAKGSKTRVCKVCGTKETAAIPVDTKNGHKFTQTEVIVAPTCTADGSAKFKCDYCGKEKEEVLKAQHRWDPGVIVITNWLGEQSVYKKLANGKWQVTGKYGTFTLTEAEKDNELVDPVKNHEIDATFNYDNHNYIQRKGVTFCLE